MSQKLQRGGKNRAKEIIPPYTINHQSRTLEDELFITMLLGVLHCYCTWFWIQFAHSPKGSLRNIKAITCFLFPNILTQGKLLVSFRSSCL